MKIDIDKIVVKDRIRKDFGNIDELAQDIQENGIINPPVVTPEYVLIAGERRLRACQSLGFREIEVRVMRVHDYEHQLRLEISENEQRKELTHSERVAYTREIERIEAVKAAERQKELAGTRPNKDLRENFPEGTTKGRTSDIVADAVGYGCGKTYLKAKHVVENAPPEIVAKLDKGEISINKAYKETKSQAEPFKMPDRELIAKQNAEILAKTVVGSPQDFAINKSINDFSALVTVQFSLLKTQIYEREDIEHLQLKIKNLANALRITAQEIDSLVSIQIKQMKGKSI